MNPDQAWQTVLAQLQVDIPKASFDTWVRDTSLVSFEDGLFTIGTRNSNSREWLESRLSSTASRLLMGIMNQEVSVRFVVKEDDTQVVEDPAGDEGSTNSDAEVLRGHSEFLTKYEAVVQPHRVILVPGYLIRLLPERGSAAFFAYTGFSQVAWLNRKKQNGDVGKVEYCPTVASVAKFAGMNRTAFHRLLNKDSFWKAMRNLVARSDTGEYTLWRTLPLSMADAQQVADWLRARTTESGNLEDAIEAALNVQPGNLVGTILSSIYEQRNLEIDPSVPVLVPDIARYIVGGRSLSESEAALADQLHTRIVNAFKDIAIRHYFITTVIRRARLSLDQAALTVASRYHCYANPKTGEVVNIISVPHGYEEMASWIGLSRGKSVWEWLSGYSRKAVEHRKKGMTVKTVNVRLGGIPGFISDVTDQQPGIKPPAKIVAVRLLEPTSFDGDESEIPWRSWEPRKDRQAYTMSMRQVLPKAEQASTEKDDTVRAGDSWNLEDLMTRAGVYPQSQEKMLAGGVDASRYLAWVYYCLSLMNTASFSVSAYPVKVLGADPASSPGKGFERLASLPPSLIKMCINATQEDPLGSKGTGFPDWDDLMGVVYSDRIAELRRILFG